MPKVSVIIPVRNAEKHLGECLDSMLGQTLGEVEVLCVDDGSTDGSAKILADYAARDARVRVLSSPCAGAGAARNKGLAEARGDYLFFCDADDWAERGMLEALLVKAASTDADIAVSGVFYYDDVLRADYRRVAVPRDVQALPQPLRPGDLGERLFSVFRQQAWDKLFRRRFVRDANLSFLEQPRVNDVSFVAVALATAKGIAVDGGAYYHYRKNLGGNLSAGINAMPDMAARAWLHVKGELERRGAFGPVRRAFARAASQALVNSLLAITDPAVAESFFVRVRDELLPLFGFKEGDVVESARAFSDDPGPLGAFMARLAREKDSVRRVRARLLEYAAELSRIKGSRAWRFLSFFGRLFDGGGLRHASRPT